MAYVFGLIKSSILFLLIVVLVSECTFTPSKENIVPIKPPEPIAFSIDVSDPGFSDPYYVKGYTKFNFVINDLSKPIISAEVLLDAVNVSAGSVNGNTVSYTLTSYVIGTHTIILRLQVATETGSLADLEGSEYYTIEKKFTIIIDPTPPNPISPPTISYENGFPTLRWNAPSQKNFYYAIKRIYKPSFIPDTLIYNTSQNNFVDLGYVGGSVTYKIFAKGYGFGQVELGSVEFNQNPIDFDITYNDLKQVQLFWNQSLINVSNSTLTVYSNIRIDLPLTSSGKFTIDTLVMGESQNYWITIARNDYPNQLYSLTKGVSQAPNLKNFNTFAMLPHHNKLLIASQKAIYRYSLPDLTLEDSLGYQDAGVATFSSLVVSEDESKGIVVGETSQLVGFDPFSFSNHMNYPIFQATQNLGDGSDITGITLGNLSNDGLLTMSLGKSTGIWGLAFEINTNNIPWKSDVSLATKPLRPPVVSNDGRYMAFDLPTTETGEVYNRSSGTFVKLGNVGSGLKFFRSTANELISTTYIAPFSYRASPQINVYNLEERPSLPSSAFTVIRGITLPARSNNSYYTEVRYDDMTQNLYTREVRNIYSTIHLLDVIDFHEKDNVQALPPWDGIHAYANGYHIISNGYIEKLK